MRTFHILALAAAVLAPAAAQAGPYAPNPHSGYAYPYTDLGHRDYRGTIYAPQAEGFAEAGVDVGAAGVGVAATGVGVAVGAVGIVGPEFGESGYRRARSREFGYGYRPGFGTPYTYRSEYGGASYGQRAQGGCRGRVFNPRLEAVLGPPTPVYEVSDYEYLTVNAQGPIAPRCP